MKKNMTDFIFGTQKKTERDANRFSKFIFEKHVDNKPLQQLEPGTLDIYIGEWLMSLCKADGTSYELDTLTAFHRSIDRYLQYHDYLYSLVTDTKFKMNKEVLLTKRK